MKETEKTVVILQLMTSQALLHPDDEVTKEDEDMWNSLLDQVKVGEARKSAEIEV